MKKTLLAVMGFVALNLSAATLTSAAMQDAVDKMLTTHAETTGAKAATIYASRALGWDKIADAVSETESASAPVGTMGVYRRDLRKAWLVHRESQYDPKGTFLIVR